MCRRKELPSLSHLAQKAKAAYYLKRILPYQSGIILGQIRVKLGAKQASGAATRRFFVR